MHTQTCQTCNRSFTTKGAGRLYCSRRCYGASRVTRVEMECAVCGASFSARPDNLEKGFAKYCSKSCSNTARKTSAADRFWRYVKIGAADECWAWLAACDGSGYGVISEDHYKQLRAPRVSYEIANGPIPEGKCVMHTCDNPNCVNPKHLRVGTVAENNWDKMLKGRGNLGKTYKKRLK